MFKVRNEFQFRTLIIFLIILLILCNLIIRRSYAKDENGNPDQPQIVLQTGHNQTVNRIVFGDQWLASAGQDNTVKIWEIATGRELRNFTGHSAPVKALAISKDGRLLASGGNDKTVRIWSVVDGAENFILRGHEGSVEAIAFSADGKFLASGGTDSIIKIWDALTGKFLVNLEGHLGWITTLAFSPDSQHLASGSADRTVKIWEIGKKWKEQTIESHKERVTEIVFSADGKFLASGASDGKIKVTALAPKRKTYFLTGHFGKILSLFFFNDNHLASGDANRTIKTWDVLKESEISSKAGVEETNEIETAAFSADGSLFAVGQGNRTVELVKVENGQILNRLESRTVGFYSVAFSDDGRWLAAGSNDKTIKLFNLKAGQARQPMVGHTGYVTRVVFTPDNKKLISTSIDQTIKIWELASGKCSHTLSAHRGAVGTLAVSSDGKHFATGSQDKTIKIWNVETAQEERTLKNHDDEVTTLAFSPDNLFLASGSSDQTVKLWDLTTQNQPRNLINNVGNVEALAFSPNGKWLAIGADKEIRIWDLSLKKWTTTLTGHTAKIYTLAFSRDSLKLVSGSTDKTIKIWQISSKNETQTLTEHSGAVYSVVFSQTGEWLASGGEDGKIILWRTVPGKAALTLTALRGGTDWLAVTPEGLFDGSPAAWKQLIWRFNNNTFNYTPVETYFNDFFYPNLLQDVLAGKLPMPKAGFELETIDRRQPKVEIISINGQTKTQLAPQSINQSATDKRTAAVVIEVADNNDKKKQPDHQETSGAQDLRLFRNGSLVKVWHDDVFDTAKSGCEKIQTKRDEPRRVRCQTEIPIVAGENNFTAYAFNVSNVKSNDDTARIEGKFPKKDGTLYVLAIGVNQYANAVYNLNFAVADVVDIGKAIEAEQNKLQADANLKQYAETRIITLKDEIATKENILLAIERFTKNSAATVLPDNLCVQSAGNLCTELKTELGKIKRATPEDALVIYYAGHGVSRGERFYLLPHNYTGKDEKALVEQAVSDIELNELLEKVDAGRLLMTIDACQSGQALGAKDAGRAPMNSKGLAQLAYDKGMYILTAAQSQQAALEAVRIGDKEIKHGLLTYALLAAFTNQEADKDGNLQLWEREWFDYTVGQVPLLQREAMKTRNIQIGQTGRGTEIYYLDGDDKTNPEDRSVQTPRVFYRREPEISPMILAKP